jgi:hypothetical protein
MAAATPCTGVTNTISRRRCRLTSIKGAALPIADSVRLFQGRRSMTTETILIVGTITAAFAVFALTLWRAERMTRDLKR